MSLSVLFMNSSTGVGFVDPYDPIFKRGSGRTVPFSAHGTLRNAYSLVADWVGEGVVIVKRLIDMGRNRLWASVCVIPAVDHFGSFALLAPKDMHGNKKQTSSHRCSIGPECNTTNT